MKTTVMLVLLSTGDLGNHYRPQKHGLFVSAVVQMADVRVFENLAWGLLWAQNHGEPLGTVSSPHSGGFYHIATYCRRCHQNQRRP